MNKILELLMSDPEMAKIMIGELVGKYKPLAYSVISELFTVYKDYANNTEYFSTVAKARKNQFDAYVAIGFSEEQAMSLLLNDIKKLSEQLSKSTSNINTSKK